MARFAQLTVPTFYFIGVTTARSSINQIFPLWSAALGRPDVVLQGVDCKLDDDPAVYREIVAHIKADPLAVGGLVTTHKINLLRAARDLFDTLDPYAEITDEISAIAKRDSHLVGYAKDPITAGRSLEALIGDGYFARTGGHILCLGGGGAATALVLHLLNKPNRADRPARMTIVDRVQARLDHLRAMVSRYDTSIAFQYILNDDPQHNDLLMARQPEGSVIINATGMGKDLAGSPITNRAQFPYQAVAWELNYRGTLDFLHQARMQQARQALTVADGWVYFVHGWTQVMSAVYDCEIDAALFAHLTALANAYRS